MTSSRQSRWNRAHPGVMQAAHQKYNCKRPNWQFRPSPQLLHWLESERTVDEDGIPETNAALLERKLSQLMQQSQGDES